MPVRIRGLMVFLTLCAIIGAGSAQQSFWVAIAGGCLLSLLGLHDRGLPAATNKSGSLIDAEAPIVLAAILNASAISAAAFGFGRLSAWFWGV